MAIILADLTERPYFPQETLTRLVRAINYAAAYENAALADANDALGDEMDSWDLTSPDYDDDVAGELIDRLIAIMADHGYTVESHDDYPGFWTLSDESDEA